MIQNMIMGSNVAVADNKQVTYNHNLAFCNVYCTVHGAPYSTVLLYMYVNG